MKINDHSYMIKYLPCFLVNFQAAIYIKTYFWQNALSPPPDILLKDFTCTTERRACSSPENSFNHKNHTFVKSFRRILNFYTYQVN